MSRRHFMKAALIASGLALLGAGGLYLSRGEGGSGPDIVSEYNGPDDPAALQTAVAAASQDRYQMVMFHAPWCPYCKKLTAQFREAGARTKVGFGVLKVDVERYPAIGAAYRQAQGVPETHVYNNGQVIDGFNGSAPDLASLLNFIETLQPPQAAPVTKPYISAPPAVPMAQ